MHEDPAGHSFGSYALLKRLARGGMAEVFLARQRGLEGFDRQVAVKRILPHLSSAPDFVQMFLTEARLAARLSHPNVVHIYEFGKAGSDYFIAMEYVDGVDAGAMIARAAADPLPPALVARIGADACAGLHHAHTLRDADGTPLGLVHRDISPPNLMVSYDGVVKLVDFGIAKAVVHSGQTRPGIVKGKFAYMSPEQTMGLGLDARSDVFSLALVLWELLAGRVAVDRADQIAAMEAIRDGKILAITDVRPDVPAALAAVLERAMQRDPRDRPGAMELGAALEAFIKSSPDMATSMHLAQWVQTRFPRGVADAHPQADMPAAGQLHPLPPGSEPPQDRPAGAGALTARPDAADEPTDEVTGEAPDDTDLDPKSAFLEDLGEGEPATVVDSSPPGHAAVGAPPGHAAVGAPPPAVGADAVSGGEPFPVSSAWAAPAGEGYGAHGDRSGHPPHPDAPPPFVRLQQIAALLPPDQRPPHMRASGFALGGARRSRRIAVAAVVTLAIAILIVLALASSSRDASPAGDADAGATSAPPASAAGDATARRAKLEVLTTPAGARVEINGNIEGVGPATFEALPPGHHEVRVSAPGYQPAAQTVELSPGAALRLDIPLEPVADRRPSRRQRARDR